jgi:hypothetical protein
MEDDLIDNIDEFIQDVIGAPEDDHLNEALPKPDAFLDDMAKSLLEPFADDIPNNRRKAEVIETKIKPIPVHHDHGFDMYKEITIGGERYMRRIGSPYGVLSLIED